MLGITKRHSANKKWQSQLWYFLCLYQHSELVLKQEYMGKKNPTDLQNESPETEMPYNMLHRTDFQGEN